MQEGTTFHVYGNRGLPAPDQPYGQKHAAKLQLSGMRATNDVRRVAVAPSGEAFAATAGGLFVVRQSFQPEQPLAELMPEWVPPAEIEGVGREAMGSGDVKEVRVDETGSVWVSTLDGVSVLQDGAWKSVLTQARQSGLGAVMSTLPIEGEVWVSTSHGGTGRLVDGALHPVPDVELPGFVYRLDEGPKGTVWVCGSDGFARYTSDGRLIDRELDGLQVRRALPLDGITYLATDQGLVIWGAGNTWGFADTPLPVADLRDLLFASDGSLWAATPRGVWRRYADGRLAYYAGERWLPSDFTRGLAEGAEGSVWVATGAGLAHLADVPGTLEEKAARFEARIRQRHQRLDVGYVTSSHLERRGDLSTSTPRPSDNDGLWTALYLAAESYRYAATGSEEALAFAQQAFRAMEWLEEVTTVPGFPTKAIVKKGDPEARHGSVPWHPSADGEWEWKGDCSSDEIAGHMYGYSIYYDLAATEAERAKVRALVEKIMGHILEHDLVMVGEDGKPTRWCVWSPEQLNENERWWAERGLNSLEILSHLRAAHHITGSPRYLEMYRHLIDQHGYAENMRRQKVDFPGHVNHSDDELAFVSYYPLLKYEDDPALREIYLESLEHNWQQERPERNPLWNLMYGVLTGEDCDAEASVRTLREIPHDLISWQVENSHRLDVELDFLADRFGRLQSVSVLPYDELPVMQWNGNPYRIDGGDGGYSENDGTFYLLPYWMARYYRYLAGPTS